MAIVVAALGSAPVRRLHKTKEVNLVFFNLQDNLPPMPRFKVKVLLISSLQKLYGDWVHALGALISGIVWLDKP